VVYGASHRAGQLEGTAPPRPLRKHERKQRRKEQKKGSCMRRVGAHRIVRVTGKVQSRLHVVVGDLLSKLGYAS
jgi:hypothetical protein